MECVATCNVIFFRDIFSALSAALHARPVATIMSLAQGECSLLQIMKGTTCMCA